MPDGGRLHTELPENQLGVVTIVVLAQHGLMGPMQSPVDTSYLSDGDYAPIL